jgi:hypothetical protein
MSRALLAPDVLPKLRTIGDLPLDDLELPSREAAEDMFDDFRKRDDLLPTTFELDPEKLFVAQRLFGDYIVEISGALLLAALPQSYATEYGAAVLGAHGELSHDLTRRIGATAQFLLTVMRRAPDSPDDQNRLWDWNRSIAEPKQSVTELPWAACVRLRLLHQVFRNELKAAAIKDPRIEKLLGKENIPALNQEDLAGMLLTFSFAVFEVLDKFGITWTADEQEAYLHLWDVVGAYLAIGSAPARSELRETYIVPSNWHGLRPPTIDQSRRLLDQIRDRQWANPTPEANVSGTYWTALRAGRVLTRALLDELEEGMPPLLKPLPVAVMRALNSERVCKRLNLGGNGVLLQSLSLLPKKEVRVAAFTSIRSTNKLGGRVLRMLANDVTARATVHFRERYNLAMPGAPDWHHTA